MVIDMERTDKRYYESAYQKDFAATVVSCEEFDGKYRLLLDGTCFYPGGGGQPCDTGYLGGMRVVECYLKNDFIYHILEGDAPAFTKGDGILGQVDFVRRFAFMQNHTGEHILSGLAKSRFGATNVGFHMSERGITMDFDKPLDDKCLADLEAMANDIVMLGLPVEVGFMKSADTRTLDMRSKRDFVGGDDVRLVCISEYDLCACAGLHVENTWEVGTVKITGFQKYKGGVRLNVFCGSDAIWDYCRKNDIVKEASRLLSAELHNTISALQKLMDSNAALKKEMAAMRNKVFEMKAAQVVLGSPIAYFFEDGLDMDDMRRFADMVARRAGMAVVLSDRKYFICSHADDVDLPDFVHRFNTTLNGRGGGSDKAAQGAVQADFAAIEEYLRNEIHG